MPLDDSLELELARIEGLDRASLSAAWAEAFGRPPPPYLSRGFQRRALIYDRQCRTYGGLSTAQRRALRAAEGDGKAGRRASGGPPALTPGAYLVREWQGRSYRVEVLAEGYRYEGTTYRSLSAIARRITGARWSGPRFFGLTNSNGGGR